MPFVTQSSRPETLAAHQQRVLRILAQVETRLDAELSLAALAKQAHLSPFHFQRVFTDLIGESPALFVRRLRLERAARQLRDTAENVRTVAARAGYSETAPFTRAFRSLFGRTPVDLRARSRDSSKPPHQPSGLRCWVHRPGPDGQLAYEPVPAEDARSEQALPVRTVHVLPMRIAFVRRRGESLKSTAAFARLAAFAGRSRVSTSPLFVRVLHDDALTPSDHRRVDFGVVIGPRRRGEGDIGVRTIGGSVHALATIAGSDRSVIGAREWLRRVGPTMLGGTLREGPIIEVQLHDPTVAVKVESRLTDVLVPIVPAREPKLWYWRHTWPEIDRPRRSRRKETDQ
jgi:AraC family transcriptional regulator